MGIKTMLITITLAGSLLFSPAMGIARHAGQTTVPAYNCHNLYLESETLSSPDSCLPAP